VHIQHCSKIFIKFAMYA